ncbi:MAG: Rnase Y domain-containing protein [Desulfobacterales bacterium]
MKSDFDAETVEARAELKKLENRLQQKEENLEKKNEQVNFSRKRLSEKKRN